MPDTNKEHIDKKAKTSTHTNLRKKSNGVGIR